MFRFENEYILYALFLLPVWVALYAYIRFKQKKIWANYGDVQLLKSMLPDTSYRMKILKFIILCLTYTALIFSLANPELGSNIEKSKRKGIDIMFCVDVSNSMLARDLSPNRLEASKISILSLLDRLKGDRVGLVVFAGKSFVQLPITSDYAAAKTFINQLSTQMISEQGTDIGTAIDLAASSMLPPKTTTSNPKGSPTNVNKVIVVISDGEDHWDEVVDIAKAASKKGIRIFTVGIGSVLGEPIPIETKGGKIQYKKDKDGNTVITRLNEKMLKDIAVAGKGNYIHASNTHVAFNELYKELEKIEKSDIEDVVYSKYISKFFIPLWIAFVLLIIEIMIYDKKILRMSQFSWLNKRINLLLFIMLGFLFSSHAQTREELKYLRQGNSHYYSGQKLDKKATELKHKKGELQQSESVQTKQQAQDFYEKASTSYLKSNQSNSDYYKSNFNLGNSLYKQGKYEDAATLFDKVINTPSINKNVKSKAYHNLGNSLLQQKKYKESIDAYKESLKLNASDMQTKYNLEYAKRMLAAQQQQQQQQQDKNQQKDKDQQQSDDQQQDKDENQQQADKKNNQQPQQKKDSERQLDALQQNERRTLEKVRNAEMKKMKKTPQEKDW